MNVQNKNSEKKLPLVKGFVVSPPIRKPEMAWYFMPHIWKKDIYKLDKNLKTLYDIANKNIWDWK